MKKVFVIVVTYKGMRWYDKCFTSLRESTYPVQTIVVDNTPGEDDANYIKEHYPEIIVMKPDHNLGFGKGNNLAMKYAREHDADYVFLLNQDTWLIDKDIITKLTQIADFHPEFGILSPMHVKADGNTIDIMLECGTNQVSYSILRDLYKGELKQYYDTNYINASAWLLPRHTLEIVGGFDPLFNHFGEDDNYIHRAIFHGLKIALCPNYKIVHDHQDYVNPFTTNKFRYYRHTTLLIKLTDIEHSSNTVSHYLWYYLRKSVISYIKFHFSKGKTYQDDLFFIIQMRKQIKRSLLKNKRCEPSWLD